MTVAYAALVQGPGWNQNSHYALTRALAEGTPRIDQTRYETASVVTGDISIYRGHTYSNKAPGFALATLPAYFAMKAAGQAWPATDASGQLWFLSLWSVVLPALVLLFLVRKLANELEPGWGTATAVVLGLGTLMLPFATMFFSHIFSALLGFAAFAVLWYERRRPSRLVSVGAAGLLVGFATTTELPNAMLAGILGLAVLARPPRIRRALAYAGGAIVGLAPLLAYDQWAFGSPFQLPYSYTVGFGPTGSFFLVAPSFRRFVDVMFAPVGVFRTTPVLVLAAVGLVLLFRRGLRFEVCVVSAVTLVYFLFEASYATPFGGGSPGPRQLIPILPFLALPLAAAFHRMPLTTLVLAAVSIGEMVAATVTHPLEYGEYTAAWFRRLGDHDFSATVLSFFSGRHFYNWLMLRSTVEWYPLVVFVIPLALAIVLAALERPAAVVTRRDALRAGLCLGGWLILAYAGPKLLYGRTIGREWAPAVTIAIAVAVILAATALPRLHPSSGGRSPA